MSKIQIDVIEFATERALTNFGETLKASEIRDAVNVVLKAFSVEKVNEDDNEPVEYQVSQNMMTNYGKNGAFDAQKRQSMAGVTFAQSDVATWLTKFLNKRINGIVVSSSRGIDKDAIVASVKQELSELRSIEEQDEELEDIEQA